MKLPARKIRKVMLIFPPVRMISIYDKMCCTPMGLLYLAGVLRKRYEVRVLDSVVEGYEQERWLSRSYFEYGLSVDEILNEVERFGPEVVGISCLFSSQFLVLAELVNRIKERFPEIITVAGGTHPSFLPEDSFNRARGLDFIILHEGEESFLELLGALERGRGLEEIDGLAWRDDGVVRVNPKTRWIKDLDVLPYPARDLVPIEKYFKINIPFLFFYKSARNLSFITSRGCPYHCRYCSSCYHWGRRIRYRSVESVLGELEELVNRWGVEEVKFEDDNLMANVNRAKAIFRGMIERGLRLHWNMPNGVMVRALEDEELLGLMKESGCYEVVLAFETGVQYVADHIIKKPIDLSKAEEIVRKVKSYGIDAHAFFIVGFPGETKEQIENTFKFAVSLPLDKAWFFIFNPLPGSELYDECVEKGLFRQEDLYIENYGFTGITTEEFDPEMLRKLQHRHYWYFTFRPLWRDPKKFFFKYLRRVLRWDNIITLSRIARTVPKIMPKE